MKDQIAKTEAERNKLLADQKTNSNKAQSDASIPGAAYHGAGTKDPTSLAQLQSQLQANQSEIKNREQAIAALAASINEYQARLNQEPVIEQQLADLTRGYDQSKSSYDDMLKKKNDSAMATSMELLQQGERFRIVDPPNLPLKPDFPNRLKLCGVGLFVGLVLGAGAVAAAEKMDDRVYGESELRKLLPVPVLSELPVIYDPADETPGEAEGMDQLGSYRCRCRHDLCRLRGKLPEGLVSTRMYKAFFNLSRNPFDISPDPRSFLQLQDTTRRWPRFTMRFADIKALSYSRARLEQAKRSCCAVCSSYSQESKDITYA